jgi:homogentisate 1,2-dioxygenase
MSGHGPDAATFERMSTIDLKPTYIGDTMAFMFETRFVARPTRFALEGELRQPDYYEVWQGLKPNFSRNA